MCGASLSSDRGVELHDHLAEPVGVFTQVAVVVDAQGLPDEPVLVRVALLTTLHTVEVVREAVTANGHDVRFRREQADPIQAAAELRG